MGVAVFAGMIGVTCSVSLLTPVFYWVVQRLGAAALARRARVDRTTMNAVPPH